MKEIWRALLDVLRAIPDAMVARASAMEELEEAKRTIQAAGWHLPGTTLSEDIERLADAWCRAEQAAVGLQRRETLARYDPD